ncbi:hypothetical protein BASA60_003027 [Batrachochytrium salamandrivorans]|nr:hypothetical protein BASA60_003027 [Batrachochytrium salamandrivorans]
MHSSQHNARLTSVHGRLPTRLRKGNSQPTPVAVDANEQRAKIKEDVDKDVVPSRFLASTFQGARYMLLQQLMTRGLTFALNMFLIRISPVELLGVVDKLDLLMSTVLFVSRESIRMALLRNTLATNSAQLPVRKIPVTSHAPSRKPRDKSLDTDDTAASFKQTTSDNVKDQLAINMSFLPLVFGVAIATACLFYDMIDRFSSIGEFSNTKYIYLVSALVELAAEPSFILLQRNLFYSQRVKAEGAAFLTQCLTTVALFLYLKNNGGITKLMKYWFPYPVNIGPNSSNSRVLLDSYYLKIAASFFFQGIIKHLLTVGDRLILVASGVGNSGQGTYRLVSDLGSLVARIVFQPIEETSRAFFSKSLTNPIAYTLPDILRESFQYLQTALQLHIILGGFFIFLAPNYTSLLLELYNKADPETSRVLSVYCTYVPIMGVNGILEAFFQGVGDDKAVRQQSYYMMGFWVVFVSTSHLLISVLRIGTSGLIVANIVNMLMRIIFSYHFARLFFTLDNPTGYLLTEKLRKDLANEFRVLLTPLALFPGNIKVWVLFGMSWLLTFFTSQAALTWGRLIGTVVHLSVGVICGVSLLGVLFYCEKDKLVARARRLVR